MIAEPGRRYTIGRSPIADIALDNPYVSERHAVLEATGEGWVIYDDGSTRGLSDGVRQVGRLVVPLGGMIVHLGDVGAGPTLRLVPGDEVPHPQGWQPQTSHIPVRGTPSVRPVPLSAVVAKKPVDAALKVQAGGRDRTFQPPGPYFVGRDPTAHIALNSPLVSQRHAAFRYDGSQWVVEDTDSKRGMFFNGARVSRVVVRGVTTIWFAAVDGGERAVFVHGVGQPRWRRRPSLLTAAALALALVAVGIAAVALVDISRAPAAVDLVTIKAATVLVSEDADGKPDGHGSGTLISADGLILTNAHVAAPAAPGQGLEVGMLVTTENPSKLAIYLPRGDDEQAQLGYFAKVVAADGWLDFAVLQIFEDADGNPVDIGRLDLPHLDLGDSRELELGDEITVAGYPGLAETFSLDVNRGEVSSFKSDDRVGDPRGYINTSARVLRGNSGGMAADDKGLLIGVPTFLLSDDVTNGNLGRLRPVHLALPLIAAAREGRDYDQYQYVQRPSGNETFDGVSWVTSDDACSDGSVSNQEAVAGYESGTPGAIAVLAYTGLVPGDHVLIGLFATDGQQFSITDMVAKVVVEDWQLGSEGDCLAVPFFPGQALPDGLYVAVAYVGPNFELEAGNSTVVEVG